MSASSSTSTPPSSNAGHSGQNSHPLLENNDEKNRFDISCYLARFSAMIDLTASWQRCHQSWDGGRLADRQDESHGQVRWGKFRWGLYPDAGYVFFIFHESFLDCAFSSGVNFMEKTISVRRTTITFSIWDLGGQREFVNMLPLVCNDAVAILFMFDLSRKSTLNSVKEWYRQARGFNKVCAYLI